MITITFKQKQDLIISFEVKGHAEYIDNDVTVYDDVVCGVVSALAQSTIIGVEEVVGLKTKYRALEGDIALDVSELTQKEIESAQVLLRTMYLSFTNIEINYNKYLKVLMKEVQ